MTEKPFNLGTTTDYGLQPEPRQPSPFWTEQEEARLRALTAEGLSCSAIGAQMGRSRNAIIGKQHRIEVRSLRSRGGNSGRDNHSNSNAPTRRYKRAPWAVEGLFANGKRKLLTELPPEVVANPVTFAALQDHHCRWPVFGEGHNTLFCGAEKFERYSWCEHHCGRAFNHTPTPSRGEREFHLRKLARDHKHAGLSGTGPRG